jgi:hypothetical protein
MEQYEFIHHSINDRLGSDILLVSNNLQNLFM